MISAASQQKLLGEYSFESVELNTEEKVIEKYTREGMEFKMVIERKEGKKHGKTQLLDEDDRVIAELTFDRGSLTGPCVICNTMGIPLFEGYLKDGLKNGICKEFDEMGRVTFEGMFVNGKKDESFCKTTESCLTGYYEERTANGKLISISQMKERTLIKHGRSVEFSVENGNPVCEKWYEDGKVKWDKIRVSGNVMSEFEENGNVVYKGEFQYLNGEFVRWGRGKEYEGVKVVLYEGGFQNGYYHGKGVLYRNKKIYLNGNWQCGYPEGEGVLYNDNMTVNMDGKWHLGYLNGIDYLSGKSKELGNEYDEREKNVKERMDKLVQEESEVEEEKKQIQKTRNHWNEMLPVCVGLNISKDRGIEELKIGANSFNENCGNLSKMKMDLSELKKLKRIEIGKECFQHVREFVIDGLESLESVKIGEVCFRIDDKERDDGVCRITNCPNLRQLEIGNRSFADFKSFELTNVNSLQSIEFGKECFLYADFSLKGE